ncbi:restriction endonuclease [Streptomyces diastaticus]|uniref:restriction endonuclease n=1 Tax=Streptomyces diastaticus TaxID=1956 RepID=UPI00365CE4AD
MIDEVAPERGPRGPRGPRGEGPEPVRKRRGARRARGGSAGAWRSRLTVRSGSVAVALAVALLVGLGLAFQGFARWAGEHPGWAVLLGLVAVPVVYALLRGMPRGRELRRAARAGMAEAEADAVIAARTARAEEPPAGPRAEAAVRAAGEAPPRPGAEEPTLVAPFRDGRTAPLPEPAPPAEEPYAPAPETAALTAAGLDAVDLAALDYEALDADGFEEAVAALCRRDGCPDAETVGGAGDLGADVLATAPDGRRVVIQCKRYGPDNKVGSQDLQRFGGTCWSVHGAQLAVLVTTSEFTAPAQEYADSCGIRCVDGAGLAAWAEGRGPAPWGPGATVG